MLGLRLRDEFKGRRLKGTAIELTNRNKTGATQIPASDFLKITYPTSDLLKTIEVTSSEHGHTVVLKGDRGQGKSHLMGALYHVFNDNDATRRWLKEWAETLGDPNIANLSLRTGMHVISESLHRQRYKFLWDLLFEEHPYGDYCKDKWEGYGDRKTDIPSDEILLEMFQHTPTVLILDEFQTWFDCLTNTKQCPQKNWAFNFIQILSEIAKEHPDLLVLVVSVRGGNTDAFCQILRVNPVIVDFKGTSAKQDRLPLLLHRLFENRIQIARDKITALVETHVSEYIRLKDIAPAEHVRTRADFVQAWPYAPHLMQLLEDQVLMVTHAQETRDLIRILVDLYKRHGEDAVVITAADFRLEDEKSGIASLLDSVANQHHANLRGKALRNLEAVNNAVANMGQSLPNLEGIIAALWLRSLAESNMAGADQATLQADITKDYVLDDNAFQVELLTIIENSFNIHEYGNRYIFREEENPQARLIVSARNDKNFQDGEDIARLTKEVCYVISGLEDSGSKDIGSQFRVIVLPQHWCSNPWEKIDEGDHPANWDERIPIIVLPQTPDNIEARLGQWLCENLQAKRNTVRFLLPRYGNDNLFADCNLIVLARMVQLAEKWREQSPEYGRFQDKYQKELREILRMRFNRFALISNWNFQEPKSCRFYIESHKVEGLKIPDAIDRHIRENLFVPEDFSNLILAAASNNEPVGKIINELREPRPNGEDCIPWLGETAVKARIVRLCAKGKIAINVRGVGILQQNDSESEDTAWKRMRGKLGTGKHLNETYILTPQVIAGSSGVAESSPEFASKSAPDDTFRGGANYSNFNVLATSSLNLLGKAESWGINAETQLQALRLKVDRLTGAQLQELLKKLPDGMIYEMGIEKEG